MTYFLAPSLAQLRAEIDARWPDRDKASDGWIGDPSHEARRSDHNPDWIVNGDRRGVVRALDIDVDGIDVDQVLDAVRGDPRAAYVIHDRRIASATDDGRPWDWEAYFGSNPHTSHIHVSIKHTRQAEIDTRPWLDPEETAMGPVELMRHRITSKARNLTVADALRRVFTIHTTVKRIEHKLDQLLAERENR